MVLLMDLLARGGIGEGRGLRALQCPDTLVVKHR
jgi:hypothetical protein